MQTILGAGGAIGVELAKALPSFTNDIRLVSRNPKAVNVTDQLFTADLNDPDQTDRAVADSQICYLTVGYAYTTRVWGERWPVLIKNVVEACARHGAKLVFFDNVYAIGGDHAHYRRVALKPHQPKRRDKGVR